MLASVHGVTEAVTKRDWQAVINAAGKSGLKAFQNMPKQVMMELPLLRIRIGRSVLRPNRSQSIPISASLLGA